MGQKAVAIDTAAPVGQDFPVRAEEPLSRPSVERTTDYQVVLAQLGNVEEPKAEAGKHRELLCSGVRVLRGRLERWRTLAVLLQDALCGLAQIAQLGVRRGVDRRVMPVVVNQLL